MQNVCNSPYCVKEFYLYIEQDTKTSSEYDNNDKDP